MPYPPTSLVKTWKMVTGSVRILVPASEESTSNPDDPGGTAGHCLAAVDVQSWGKLWETALPKSQKTDVMEEPDVNYRAVAPGVWNSSALKVSLAFEPEKKGWELKKGKEKG